MLSSACLPFHLAGSGGMKITDALIRTSGICSDPSWCSPSCRFLLADGQIWESSFDSKMFSLFAFPLCIHLTSTYCPNIAALFVQASSCKWSQRGVYFSLVLKILGRALMRYWFSLSKSNCKFVPHSLLFLHSISLSTRRFGTRFVRCKYRRQNQLHQQWQPIQTQQNPRPLRSINTTPGIKAYLRRSESHPWTGMLWKRKAKDVEGQRMRNGAGEIQ